MHRITQSKVEQSSFYERFVSCLSNSDTTSCYKDGERTSNRSNRIVSIQFLQTWFWTSRLHARVLSTPRSIPCKKKEKTTFKTRIKIPSIPSKMKEHDHVANATVFSIESKIVHRGKQSMHVGSRRAWRGAKSNGRATFQPTVARIVWNFVERDPNNHRSSNRDRGTIRP